MQRILAGVLVLVPAILLTDRVDADDSAQTMQRQRIRVIVELLASKNAAPRMGSDGFPPSYDRNAQVVVYLASQQLLNEGSAAFDILIEHLNDKRYSYTQAEPDSDYNRTVGDVC